MSKERYLLQRVLIDVLDDGKLSISLYNEIGDLLEDSIK
jgi:hypothetical protein